MAKDLINRRSLVGSSRSRVLEMLGQPDYTDVAGKELYYLIREDIDGFDPIRLDHLLVILGRNQTTVDAKITVVKRE